jgi:hypothetical protein
MTCIYFCATEIVISFQIYQLCLHFHTSVAIIPFHLFIYSLYKKDSNQKCIESNSVNNNNTLLEIMLKKEEVAYLSFKPRICLERLMKITIILEEHFTFRESNLVATKYKLEALLCELTR